MLVVLVNGVNRIAWHLSIYWISHRATIPSQSLGDELKGQAICQLAWRIPSEEYLIRKEWWWSKDKAISYVIIQPYVGQD